MSPEELDEATVEEAKRRWLSTPALRIHGTLGEDAPFIAARLARENWTPPEPVVDPDLMAFREWVAKGWPGGERRALSGEVDNCDEAKAYLAGARMATERARKREALRELTRLTEEYGGYEELKGDNEETAR